MYTKRLVLLLIDIYLGNIHCVTWLEMHLPVFNIGFVNVYFSETKTFADRENSDQMKVQVIKS